MEHLYECRLKCDLPRIVETVVDSIHKVQKINHIEKHDLPSRAVILEILDDLFSLLFPGYIRQDLCEANLKYFVGELIDRLFVRLRSEISKALLHNDETGKPAAVAKANRQAEETVVKFLGRLPEVRRLCEGDVQAAYDGDPAAKSLSEVIFSYPGFSAVTIYRLAHELLLLGTPLIPRIMTEIAHMRTGIDIHPGATIGERFFIDHGTGVVIGETTNIGNKVAMYHGVTLGAYSPRKGQSLRGIKRHPTIEDNVTIYPNATILGGDTVVGKGSVIGGNVWLTHSVPPHSTVIVEAPAPRIIRKKNGRA
jgi:serine O-acetyltransferase